MLKSKLVLSQEKCREILIYTFITQLLAIVAVYVIIANVSTASMSMEQNIVLFRNFFCIIVSTIILFGYIRQRTFPIEKMYFIMMGVSISISLTADIITWVVDGHVEYANINKFFVAIDIMSNPILDFLFWRFIKYTYDPEGKTYKKYEDKVVVFFLMVGILIAIADGFFGFGFYIDSNGISQPKAPGVYSLYLASLVLSIMIIIAIIRVNISNREKAIVLFYIIAPLAVFAVYVINDNSSISFYPLVFATYFFIFCNLVVYREKVNIKNQAIINATKKELDVATKIQTSILPLNFSDYDNQCVDLYALMEPAKEVGGDFYDFFKVGDNKLAIVIADVSGKGIPAAMFMMRAKSLIKSTAEMDLSPAAVLTKVNEQLCMDNSEKMFITAWLGIVDLDNNKLAYANAGHNYPVIRNSDGSVEFLENIPKLFLAGMSTTKYQDNEIDFKDNMSIFLYTDGVSEAKDIENHQFGDDRLLESLSKCTNYGMEETCLFVRERLSEFAGEAPQFDDITMLSLKL